MKKLTRLDKAILQVIDAQKGNCDGPVKIFCCQCPLEESGICESGASNIEIAKFARKMLREVGEK